MTESKNSGGQSSKFKPAFMTARVVWRAVAINKINLNRLKAGMLAGSHLSPNGVLRLPGRCGGQWLSKKSALSYCWFKPEISKSYHHRISKSIKVTASTPHIQVACQRIYLKVSWGDCLWYLISPLHGTAHVYYFARLTAGFLITRFNLIIYWRQGWKSGGLPRWSLSATVPLIRCLCRSCCRNLGASHQLCIRIRFFPVIQYKHNSKAILSTYLCQIWNTCL